MPESVARVFWKPRTALWVVAGIAFLIPPSFWALRQIELRNDVENWLPRQDAEAQVLTWFHEQFPRGDRVLLTWDGSSLNDPRTPRLAARLRGRKDARGVRRHGLACVETVVTPHDVLARMESMGVDREEALRRLSGVLIGAGPIRVKLSPLGDQRRVEVIERIAAVMEAEFGIRAQVVRRGAEDEDEEYLEYEADSVAAMDERGDGEETPHGPRAFSRAFRVLAVPSAPPRDRGDHASPGPR